MIQKIIGFSKAALFAALCSAALLSCGEYLAQSLESALDKGSAKKNETQSVFFCRIDYHEDVSQRYHAERLFISGPDGQKTGMALNNLNTRFKIVIPKSYVGKDCNFTIEFSRGSSFLDSIPELKANPLALGILKAFYYTTPVEYPYVIPENGGELIIKARDKNNGDEGPIKIEDLKMGYSDQSEDILSNMTNIPPLYKLEINQDAVSVLTSVGWRAYMGIAQLPSDPSFSLLNFLNLDPNNYAGFAGGEDWYLVLNDKTLGVGDPLRLTLIYTKSNSLPKFAEKTINLPQVFQNISLNISSADFPIWP